MNCCTTRLSFLIALTGLIALIASACGGGPSPAEKGESPAKTQPDPATAKKTPTPAKTGEPTSAKGSRQGEPKQAKPPAPTKPTPVKPTPSKPATAKTMPVKPAPAKPTATAAPKPPMTAGTRGDVCATALSACCRTSSDALLFCKMAQVAVRREENRPGPNGARRPPPLPSVRCSKVLARVQRYLTERGAIRSMGCPAPRPSKGAPTTAKPTLPKPPLSLAALKTGCAKGQAVACLTLGQRYLGKPDKDMAKAVAATRRACDLGVAYGCYVAASLVRNHIHKGKVTPDVVQLMNKGCGLKNAASCNSLATFYAQGKNYRKSNPLYLKACKLGYGLGCFNAGNIYRVGEGVPVDYKKAASFFERSCKLKQAKGCSELGIFYYLGKGVAKDVRRAVSLLQLACKLGSRVACANLKRLKPK